MHSIRNITFALLLIGGAASALSAQATGKGGSSASLSGSSASLFTLAAQPSFTAYVDVNELTCLMWAESICDKSTQGFAQQVWPKGTPNALMYAAGVRLTGMIPAGAGCTQASRAGRNTPDCFAWSGDTTGVGFGGEGGVHHAAPATWMYNSRDAADVANWPRAGSIPNYPTASGIITDTGLFDASLIGRHAISEMDTWMLQVDDPSRSSGRPHALGVMAERRTMVWNFPFGNEATIYVMYKITNITNNKTFQTHAETRHFGGLDSLPDAGWRLDSLYFTFDADPDVGVAAGNYLTASVPFGTMFAYDGDFTDPAMQYPAEQFHPPFFDTSPPLVGMQLVRTPTDKRTGRELGLTSFTNFTSGGAFPMPTTVQRFWRVASLNLDPSKGDAQCNLPAAEIKAKRMCFVPTVKSDWRGSVATGPFSLEPGKSETIIIAITGAAPVETPLITVDPTANNIPGFPSLAPGCNGDPIRPIDVAAGYTSPRTCPSPGAVIDPAQVAVVPGSLLGKSQVAREIVANRFLMPTAPAAPAFALLAGDNSITIAWDASETESVGDPYAPIAANPLSLLNDLNFRRSDVEGYRVYRGTTPTDLKLIATFDKRDTEFVDRLCVTDPMHVDGTPCNATVTTGIWDYPVQYRNVTTTANGAPRVIRADTAAADAVREGRVPSYLTNSGIPFAYRDATVRNGFNYYYKVTAFDINSILSGPSSLESPGEVKRATPRASGAEVGKPRFVTRLAGRAPLANNAAPAINPATGTFDRAAQPTAGLQGELAVFAAELLKVGVSSLRIDSIVPSHYVDGSIGTYHLSANNTAIAVTVINSFTFYNASRFREDIEPIPLASDPRARALLTGRGLDAPSNAATLDAELAVERANFNSLLSDWAYKQPGFFNTDPPVTNWAGGSRWYSGSNEAMSDPTVDVRMHGRVDGATRIFQPTPYWNLQNPGNEPLAFTQAMASYRGTNGTLLSPDIFRRFSMMTLALTRAADVRLYWGSAGALDSIIDLTHNVTVPFSTAVRASYGFLDDNDGDGKITYGDFYYLEGMSILEIAPLAAQKKPLLQQPRFMNVDATGDLNVDGSGFGLYINGEPYIFQGSPPAGSTWTLRTYNGSVARTNGVYSFTPTPSNPAVPGLAIEAVVTEALSITNATADLSKVHTVPDPYYGSSAFSSNGNGRELHFVNLPPVADLRIYSLTGVLIHVINHNDATGGGLERWDLRTRNGSLAASGVYYFHVRTPDGRTAIGKFTIVNGPN